jgi:DNA polymerase
MKDKWIGLDFETYGAVDLTVHGLERYAADKSFQPLLAGVVWFGGNYYLHTMLDFVQDYDGSVARLRSAVDEAEMIVAHNAGFERRVLQAIGIDLPASKFIDSAVVARAAGAGGKLEAAAPQLLGTDKLASGWDLIKLFSIPGKYQEENGSRFFDPRIVEDHPDEWATFKEYCRLDAKLGLRLALSEFNTVDTRELGYQAVTMEMNQLGWPVDVELVEEMQRRYLENVEVAVEDFRHNYDAVELNLNSLKQLKEWCLERGIKATSFDEKNVEKLRKRILKRVDTMEHTDERFTDYCEVVELLNTKQLLGGSSLKKLQVILDTVGADGRLRDQYLHIGAGQTWRTTGRSVQMQNLKRLKEPANMNLLWKDTHGWDNEKLAENLRQVFTSSHGDGQLIVGDFSSVESRGLAWLAGEQWKLDSYAQGKDLYKVLASKIYSVHYDDVLKSQRQVGKVGELSCGYGAGAGAVNSFAENMGVEFSDGEAAQLVKDWRDANPKVVNLWDRLDSLLHEALDSAVGAAARTLVGPRANYMVQVFPSKTPTTLIIQHPGAKSLTVELLDHNGVVLTRVFHGCYRRGRNIGYYKPSERKTGDLWKNHFTDPKTKQVMFYTIYGGKLAGILTQSFCRELFFQALETTYEWVRGVRNVDLIGQFHDEIVLDWWPDKQGLTINQAKGDLERIMSNTNVVGFPMACEVKSDYRYTK